MAPNINRLPAQSISIGTLNAALAVIRLPAAGPERRHRGHGRSRAVWGHLRCGLGRHLLRASGHRHPQADRGVSARAAARPARSSTGGNAFALRSDSGRAGNGPATTIDGNGLYRDCNRFGLAPRDRRECTPGETPRRSRGFTVPPLKASWSDRYGRARMGRAGLSGSLHSRQRRGTAPGFGSRRVAGWKA